MLGVSAIAAALQIFLGKQMPLAAAHPDESSQRKMLDYFSLLAVGVAATLANPRGLSFYNTVLNYIANPVVLSKTDEWRALDLTAGVGVWFFLILGAITIIALLKTKGGLKLPETAVMCAFFAASVLSMRMVPYCSLMVIPFSRSILGTIETKTFGIGCKKANRKKRWRNSPKLEARIEGDEPKGWKLAVIYIVITIAMSVAFLTMDMFKVKDFDATRIPVKLVECLQRENPPGLGFNYDNWGGYIYFKLKKTVFIDDWTDFLPPKFIDDYLKMLLTQEDWETLFNKYNFTWVMVPKEAQLGQVLSQRKDWEVKCKDDVGIFLVRRQSKTPKL